MTITNLMGVFMERTTDSDLATTHLFHGYVEWDNNMGFLGSILEPESDSQAQIVGQYDKNEGTLTFTKTYVNFDRKHPHPVQYVYRQRECDVPDGLPTGWAGTWTLEVPGQETQKGPTYITFTDCPIKEDFMV